MPRILYFLSLFLVLGSCLKNVDDSVGVSTEDIIYTSGERMVVTARILATAEVELKDHGFIVSTDENFSNPINLSLGERINPGRFVGEYEGLDVDQNYFVKSYIETSSGKLEGNVLTFNTLLPVIDDFSPRVGLQNSQMVIQGRNLTDDAKVFFGDREASIVTLTDESNITVIIPSIEGDVFEDINVVMRGKTFTGPEKFEYVIGEWEQVSQFNQDFNFLGGISMRIDNNIIFGLGGLDGFGPYTSLMFKYNTESQVWSPESSPGIATGFSFSCDGFIGSGSSIFVRPTDKNYALSQDFYKYENDQFTYAGQLPFRLLKSSAVRVNNEVYVFGGLDEEIEPNFKVFRYDINLDDWSEANSLPFGLVTNSDYPHFTEGQNIYFMGDDSYIYRYNLGTQETAKLTRYPTTVSSGGLGEVIGGKAYVGVFDDKRLIYELDLTTLKWKEKTGFRGSVRDRVIASWVEDDKIFLMKNGIFVDERITVWSFSPEEF